MAEVYSPRRSLWLSRRGRKREKAAQKHEGDQVSEPAGATSALFHKTIHLAASPPVRDANLDPESTAIASDRSLNSRDPVIMMLRPHFSGQAKSGRDLNVAGGTHGDELPVVAKKLLPLQVVSAVEGHAPDRWT